MKLKLVVASMSLLGFITSSVFAATETTQTDTKTTQTTQTTEQSTTAKSQPTHKHKSARHHRLGKKHHHYVAHRAERDFRDYRPMGYTPVAAPMMTAPRFDFYQSTFDGMAQAYGRAKPCPDWFRRIGVSGGVNFDTRWGNRSVGFMGVNVNRFAVNDAYLNFHAAVNDWTSAFLSVSFSDPSTRLYKTKLTSTGLPKLGKYSNVYNFADDPFPLSNNINDASFSMEQAYLLFDNFNCWPLFVKLGKQYMDFGRYQIHPITRTMTQVMSETLRTAATVGFITPCGLHGSGYAFQTPLKNISGETTGGFFDDGSVHTAKDTTWGVALGYTQPCAPCLFGINYDIGAAYMSNMVGVNDVQYAVMTHRLSAGAFGENAVAFNTRVSALAVHADLSSGPFSFGARYATALQKFSGNDLATVIDGTTGARPWAFDLTAGYTFMGCWGRNHNLYVGYQASRDAVEMFLPRNRWLAGYNVDVLPKTNVGLEFNHDQDYAAGSGGTGNSYNSLNLRVAVKFG